MLSFAGIFGNIASLVFTPETVDYVLPIFLDLFTVDASTQDFFLNHYIPEFRNATVDLHLDLDQKSSLLKNTVGTLIKLFYAFVWQEQFLYIGDVILTPDANTLGAILLPLINDLGNSLTSWELKVIFTPNRHSQFASSNTKQSTGTLCLHIWITF